MSATDERGRARRPPAVLFTDLDGTLLDPDDYSFTASIEAVRTLQADGVPVVFCSSKTRAEQERYRESMDVQDPFVVEDGSAVFVPEGYFSEPPDGSLERDGYRVIELGTPYDEVRRLAAVLERDLGAKGYGSMSSDEVSELTGLSAVEAPLAKRREYSETVVIDKGHVERAMGLIEDSGLTATFGGRFHTIKGDTDKGKAVMTVVDLYEREFGPVLSIGVGDSWNDLPMLRAVDEAYLVVRKDPRISPEEPSCRPVGSFNEAVESARRRLSLGRGAGGGGPR